MSEPTSTAPVNAVVRLRLNRVIAHPEDVAEIRSRFAARGYDVTEEDIQDAYAEFSEREWGASWMSLDYTGGDGLVDKLLPSFTESI